MKFCKDILTKTRYIETDNGISYRTNAEGTVWERLYGESWESVYGKEEDELILEFTRYFYEKYGDCKL